MTRSQEVEEEGDYNYLTLHCHHQNDSCIKMGGDESHFNGWLTVKDRVGGVCNFTPFADGSGGMEDVGRAGGDGEGVKTTGRENKAACGQLKPRS